MYKLKDSERIFIFTGPEGAGRSTIADMVGSTLGIRKVISYTTRKPRPIEVDGQDYHFINRDQFQAAEARNEFLERIEFNHNLYGIKDSEIAHMFASFLNIFLIVNPAGAETLKGLYGDKAVRIFIYADRDTVEARQREKGLSESEIDNHLAHYDADMAYMKECEHAFENLDLSHVVFDISNVLEGYLQRNLLEKD